MSKLDEITQELNIDIKEKVLQDWPLRVEREGQPMRDMESLGVRNPKWRACLKGEGATLHVR